MMLQMDSRRDQILSTFKRFDADGDGVISKDELMNVFSAISPTGFDTGTFDDVFAAADANGDGKIQYEEFVDFVFGMCPKKIRTPRNNPGLEYRSWLPERFEVDISQRYALDKLELGKGCYGKVFVAKDKACANRVVAIKKVTKTHDHDTNDSFYTEITIMKDLDHANICKLFGTYEEGRNIFFIMEYCEGGDLCTRIQKQGHITEDLSADILSQVSSALRYAHSRSIAHRDLKPENVVFCSKDPENTMVKLIDWGLGISFAATRMRSAVGSFTYSAPEVMASSCSKGYSSACDLWSLGVLAFVMLSGNEPFSGSAREHIKAALAESYSMEGDIWDDISEEAKNFVRGLLRADPEKRVCIEDVGKHPWLEMNRIVPEARPSFKGKSQEVLDNIRSASQKSLCSKICCVAIARHMNHTDVRNIYNIFRKLDKSGDGVLSIEELRDGFSDAFGKDAGDSKDIERVFSCMDLNRSGTIDYTEFLAASLGEKLIEQDEAVWAAFKAFDVMNTGKISKDDLRQVLANADVQKAWTPWLCESLVNDFLKEFDTDCNGEIDFEHWKEFMRRTWDNQNAPSESESPTGSNCSPPPSPYRHPVQSLKRRHRSAATLADQCLTKVGMMPAEDFLDVMEDWRSTTQGASNDSLPVLPTFFLDGPAPTLDSLPVFTRALTEPNSLSNKTDSKPSLAAKKKLELPRLPIFSRKCATMDL
jgi:calcium-dependent protein kinase